jgi:hypothetical protein
MVVSLDVQENRKNRVSRVTLPQVDRRWRSKK